MPVAGILDERVRIPEGVQVRLEGDDVVIAGKGHTLRRKLGHPRVRIAVQGGEVSVTSEYPTKREKALVGTYAAHVRNLILGVTQGFEYEMKGVYSHFPAKGGA